MASKELQKEKKNANEGQIKVVFLKLKRLSAPSPKVDGCDYRVSASIRFPGGKLYNIFDFSSVHGDHISMIPGSFLVAEEPSDKHLPRLQHNNLNKLQVGDTDGHIALTSCLSYWHLLRAFVSVVHANFYNSKAQGTAQARRSSGY